MCYTLNQCHDFMKSPWVVMFQRVPPLAIGTITSCFPAALAPLFGARGCRRSVESFEDNNNKHDT